MRFLRFDVPGMTVLISDKSAECSGIIALVSDKLGYDGIKLTRVSATTQSEVLPDASTKVHGRQQKD